MTKEEAIDILARINPHVMGKENWREVSDALNIAIESMVRNELLREEEKHILWLKIDTWLMHNASKYFDKDVDCPVELIIDLRKAVNNVETNPIIV